MFKVITEPTVVLLKNLGGAPLTPREVAIKIHGEKDKKLKVKIDYTRVRLNTCVAKQLVTASQSGYTITPLGLWLVRQVDQGWNLERDWHNGGARGHRLKIDLDVGWALGKEGKDLGGVGEV